jgi:hypothetical protein
MGDGRKVKGKSSKIAREEKKKNISYSLLRARFFQSKIQNPKFWLLAPDSSL